MAIRSVGICVASLLLSLMVVPVWGHDLRVQIEQATQRFVSSLDQNQQRELSFPFADDLRTNWQFVPMERSGLSFAEMRPDQRLLALNLMNTVLSHRGYSQTLQIMALEQVLHELENFSAKRDPENYHFFLFGDPSPDDSWAWRIEGHHLSLNFTIVGGELIVATPSFLGANPARITDGPRAGWQPLMAEENLARALVQQFSAKQRQRAIISTQAPRDIINGPGRNAERLEPSGISVQDLTDDQRSLLKQLIGLYVDRLHPELAQQYWTQIDDAGFDKICFGWAGPLEAGKPHYYRLQGPTFILEFDNTQNNANHVHCVWRDFHNDFGADLLKQHYRAHPHLPSQLPSQPMPGGP